MIQSLTWVNILLSLVFSPITLGYLPYLVNHFGEGIVIKDTFFWQNVTSREKNILSTNDLQLKHLIKH